MERQLDHSQKSRSMLIKAVAFAIAGLVATAGVSWADAPHGGSKGHGSYGHAAKSYGHGYGKRHDDGHHVGTAHFLKHVLKHKEDLELTEDQAQKIHDLKMSYKKDKIRLKADLKIAKLEFGEVAHDENSDLGQIEAKFKDMMDLKTKLFMTAVKTRRAAREILTVDQIQKIREIHEQEKRHHGKGHYGKRHGKTKHHAKDYAHGKKDGHKKGDGEDGEKAKMAKKAKVSIVKAIEAATKRVDGTVIEAELEEEEDVLVWEVEIVTADGELVTVLVDPVTADVVGGAE